MEGALFLLAGQPLMPGRRRLLRLGFGFGGDGNDVCRGFLRACFRHVLLVCVCVCARVQHRK